MDGRPREPAGQRPAHGRRKGPLRTRRTHGLALALGQTLNVTEGVALMQARGKEILEVHPGRPSTPPPGEERWHGATPDYFTEHLAVLENGDDPAATTTWLEQVTDEEYHRA
jgi:hypothetical protein